MGLTYVKAEVKNTTRPKRKVTLELLVDSGASYSLIPAPLLQKIGIKPTTRKSFVIADGRTVQWAIGHALFRVNGEEAPSPVIFGEPTATPLLGAMSLEALGLAFDPVNKKLTPITLVAASPRLA